MLQQLLRYLTTPKMRRAVKSFVAGHSKGLPIYDMVLEDKQTVDSRALLSYVTYPFRILPSASRSVNFTNAGIAISLVRVLNRMGYSVDVVDWTDTIFVPRKPYDLFIGHGGVNFEQIAKRLNSAAVRIYFSTGVYWLEHNRREEARFRWLATRRGMDLPRDRWIFNSEEPAARLADGIICLGNSLARESYRDFPVVFNLNNAAYFDDHYERSPKNFDEGRSRFLFFAGGGSVHKGLDLILEAFATLAELELFVCQELDLEFCKVFEPELRQPNIHVVGHIPLRGSEFYQIVQLCNFAISASCSEGSAGSLIECMHQGLIPVVTRESGIDVDDFGLILNSCDPKDIAKTLKDLSSRPATWAEEMSRRTRDAALGNFSEQAFMRNLQRGIQQVITAERSTHPDPLLR